MSAERINSPPVYYCEAVQGLVFAALLVLVVTLSGES
jgi:hypothetical protein